MANRANLLPGTLDTLVLKAVSLGATHGYGVLLRIEEMTHGAILVEQGALYPALYRLEQEGLLSTEWGVSSNNRRAKFYSLTVDGKRGLRARIKRWERLSEAMATALIAEPEEAS
jgi:transcriptional regulator